MNYNRIKHLPFVHIFEALVVEGDAEARALAMILGEEDMLNDREFAFDLFFTTEGRVGLQVSRIAFLDFLLKEASGVIWESAIRVRSEMAFFAARVGDLKSFNSIIALTEEGLRCNFTDFSTSYHAICDAGNLELLKQFMAFFSKGQISQLRQLEEVMRHESLPPLHLHGLVNASCGGHLEVVRYILDEEIESMESALPLYKACERNDTRIIDEWMERGGNISMPFFGKMSTVIHSIRGESDRVLQALSYLVQKWGVSLDTRDAEGNTALHRAILYPKRLLRLISLGADVNATNANGFTPLHLAVVTRCGIAIEPLIEHGSDINHQTQEHGISPLMWASYSPAAIKNSRKLLELGANPHLKDKNGFNALERIESEEEPCAPRGLIDFRWKGIAKGLFPVLKRALRGKRIHSETEAPRPIRSEDSSGQFLLDIAA